MITAARSRTYYEARLPHERFTSRAEVKVRCPFHDDKNPSCSINLEKGVWKCHAGCGGGGVLDFEMRYSRCDRDTARANVAELTGEPQFFVGPKTKPQVIYDYHDAFGRLLFQKLRYPHSALWRGPCSCGQPSSDTCSARLKHFDCRRPNGKGGWISKLDGVPTPRPLYHLPEVLVANHVFICEGEKDADNVRALNLSKPEKNWLVAATTNFDGADGKWRDEYSVFFAGKSIVIFPDNDESGRKHAEQVAASVHRYAASVRVVPLPGLPEKGDVSDYLQSHTAEDLCAEIRKAPQWSPVAFEGPKLLVPVPKFAVCADEQVNWMVEGIIERGANGAIVAEPKIGKSWVAIDLAISLALGTDFMGFKVPRHVKVALVSREDNPPLTAWRIRHLIASKQTEHPELLETNLWINTRQQSKQLLLNNPEQLAELLADLHIVKPEFLILDVLNTLHTKKENDNTEMREVFAHLEEIQREIGCGIGVVHHYNKSESGSITQRMRGSSAIAGWCEWMIGIELEDAEQKVRKMHFELKAAAPPEPIYWVITSDLGVAQLKPIPRTDETCGRVQ